MERKEKIAYPEAETKFRRLTTEQILAVLGKLSDPEFGAVKVFSGLMHQVYFDSINGGEVRVRKKIDRRGEVDVELPTELNMKLKKSDDGTVKVVNEPELLLSGRNEQSGFEVARVMFESLGFVDKLNIWTVRDSWQVFGLEEGRVELDRIYAPVRVKPYFEIQGANRGEVAEIANFLGLDMKMGESISKRKIVTQELGSQ